MLGASDRRSLKHFVLLPMMFSPIVTLMLTVAGLTLSMPGIRQLIIKNY